MNSFQHRAAADAPPPSQAGEPPHSIQPSQSSLLRRHDPPALLLAKGLHEATTKTTTRTTTADKPTGVVSSGNSEKKSAWRSKKLVIPQRQGEEPEIVSSSSLSSTKRKEEERNEQDPEGEIESTAQQPRAAVAVRARSNDSTRRRRPESPFDRMAAAAAAATSVPAAITKRASTPERTPEKSVASSWKLPTTPNETTAAAAISGNNTNDNKLRLSKRNHAGGIANHKKEFRAAPSPPPMVSSYSTGSTTTAASPSPSPSPTLITSSKHPNEQQPQQQPDEEIVLEEETTDAKRQERHEPKAVTAAKSSSIKFAAAERWRNRVTMSPSPPPMLASSPAWKRTTTPSPRQPLANVVSRVSTPSLPSATSQRPPQRPEDEEEAPSTTTPPRLRVSDVRSMFQQQEAAAAPVRRSFKSPSGPQPSQHRRTGSFPQVSPPPPRLPKMPSPVEDRAQSLVRNFGPNNTTEIITSNGKEEEEAVKRWKPLPLRQVETTSASAAGNGFVSKHTVVVNGARSIPIPPRLVESTSAARNGLATKTIKREEETPRPFLATMNYDSSNSDENIAAFRSREAAIEPPVLLELQEEETRQPMIETSPLPKISVSAMTYKLYDAEAEKPKIPIKPTLAPRQFEPSSPIADTRRKLDTVSLPSSPLLSTPPRKVYQDNGYEDPPLTPVPDDDSDDDMDEQHQLSSMADHVTNATLPRSSNHRITTSPVQETTIRSKSRFLVQETETTTTRLKSPPIVQKTTRLESPRLISPPLMAKKAPINSPPICSGKVRSLKMLRHIEQISGAIDDDQNSEFKDQSTDVLALGDRDSFSEYDWVNEALSRKDIAASNNESKMARTMESADDKSVDEYELPAPHSEQSLGGYSSVGPIDSDDIYFSMFTGAKKTKEETFALENPTSDTTEPTKTLSDRRGRHGKSSKRGRKSQSGVYEAPPPATIDFVFSSFDETFESKVDNETANGDKSLAPPQLMKPLPRRSRNVISKRGSYNSNELVPSASDCDRLPHSFVATAPPSGPFEKDGSVDGVWSHDIEMSIGSLSKQRDFYKPGPVALYADPITYPADEESADGIHKTPTVSATSSKLKTLATCFSTSPFARCMQRWKWQLNGLFNRRVIGVGVFRYLLAKRHITYGQLVLLLPLVFFTVACSYVTFANKNTGVSGKWAFYAVMYAFMLAHKQASVFQLVGLSWDQLVPVHYAASVTALILSTMHAYVAYTGHDYRPCRERGEFTQPEQSQWPLCRVSREYRNLDEIRLPDNPRFRHSSIGPDPDLWKFLWDGPRNTSGSWILSCLFVLLALSAFRWTLRRPCFDVWLALHIAASGAIIAYCDKHRVFLFIVLLIWWAFDGLLRYGLGTMCRLPKTATLSLLTWRSEDRSHARSTDSNEGHVHHCSIVELSFDKKFHYRAGQYIRIAVMETGQPVMFHPMTISSAPYEDRVTVHFRPFGGWTRQLANMGARKGSSRISGTVHLLLEGPYGSVSMNLWENPSRYPVVILIAGGIGVTPISSIARQLLYEHERAGRERKMIRVVWAVRELGLVEALPLLGQEIPEESEISTKVMVDPWRQLQRNKGRDGLVLDHPKPLYSEHFADNVRPESSEPSLIFDASIYVTRKNLDNKDKVSNDPKSGASVRSYSSSLLFGHRTPEQEDEMELGRIVEPHLGVEAPLPKEKPRHVHGKSDAACLYDDRFSFYTGRPDVQAILKEAATLNDFAKGQRIAVIACGPQALVQDTKEACAHLSGIVPMDFHEEMFLL